VTERYSSFVSVCIS